MSGAPVGVEFWIVISTCLVAGGWILSALGQLNKAGYLAVFAVMAGVCWRLWNASAKRRSLRSRLVRFRRPLPMLFLILSACALIGGLLYAPANWDALAYRMPRVLNWLDAEKWHWIHSNGPRVNVRATGFEWLMAPLILFTKSDRALFAINFISFLLLPGLVFSVFTRMGVRPRVAWYWMWLLPGGYAFVLQAASIANDSFATVYALAAVDFGLRGLASRRFKDFAFSLLAVGLLTGAKATNLPLALPWLIAALPLILLWLRQKPVSSVAAVVLAALISFFPMAVLNHLYSGDWTGLTVERVEVPNLTVKNPAVGVAAHSFLLLIHNVIPPFFPFARWYNEHLVDFLPGPVIRTLNENFHDLGVFALLELPGEDSSCGIGFGATVLLLAALVAVATRRGWRLRSAPLMGRWQQIALCAAPFLAVCVVMARSGFACSRLITPFYPFMFASLLLFDGHAQVIRSAWWRRTAMAMMLLSVLVVAVTPPRPLFPVRVLEAIAKRWPGNALVNRAHRVYSVYAQRADALGKIREALPANLNVVGLASSIDDPEVSLWRPFSTRRVVHIVRGDDPDKIRKRGIQYVVLNDQALQRTHRTTLQNWCQQYHAEVLRQLILPRKATEKDERWYIVRITDTTNSPGQSLRAELR